MLRAIFFHFFPVFVEIKSFHLTPSMNPFHDLAVVDGPEDGEIVDDTDTKDDQQVVDVSVVLSRASSSPPPTTKKFKSWTPRTAMPFGKYKGTPIDAIPIGYLRFLGGYDWDAEQQKFVQPLVPESQYDTHAQVRDYFTTYRICLGCGRKGPDGAAPDSLWGQQNMHRDCYMSQVTKGARKMDPSNRTTASQRPPPHNSYGPYRRGSSSSYGRYGHGAPYAASRGGFTVVSYRRS